MSNWRGNPRVRFGPWSRVIWWIVVALALWALTTWMGVNFDWSGRPQSSWSFVVVPIGGVLLFPIAYALDRILTPQTLKEAFDACFNPALGSLTEDDWARPAIG